MTATLHPYPAYKPSGVDWLGDVPEHWDVRRTKTLIRERSEKGRPSEALLAATQTKGVVRKEQYENRTVLALKDLHLLKLVKIGDFVISLRSFQGGIEYAREQGIISPAYTILYPMDSSLHDYLALLFKSKPYLENLTLHVTGIRQGQNIDYSELSRSYLPLPPYPEQAAIVRYVDHADRRIRRYVTAKRKLIALLEEERQAVINQAVIRGLDPNARLKPSGVEWLGDVPEHWEVTALYHKYSQSLGKMLDSKRIKGDHLLPYLRNIDIQWDRINIDDLPTMDIPPSEYDRYTVRPGDLLVCEGGEVGRSALWSGELAICGFQKALHRLRPRRGDAPRFMHYVLHAASNRDVFSDGHVSTIAHLTGDKLRTHRFQFPPLHEQADIVKYLDRATADTDAAIARARRQIELVQEYRTRLIADVVTGTLDVREATAQLLDEADDQDLIGESGTLADGLPGDLYDIDESVEDSVMEEEVTA